MAYTKKKSYNNKVYKKKEWKPKKTWNKSNYYNNYQPKMNISNMQPKRDNMMCVTSHCGVPNAALLENSVVGEIPANMGVHYIMWSPTFREAVPPNRAAQLDRQSASTFFTGWKDNLSYQFKGQITGIHLRVVISTRREVESAQPFIGPGNTLCRNLAVRDMSDETLDQFLSGTRDVDWTLVNVMDTMFDPAVCKVMFRQRKILGAADALLKTEEFYHPIRRPMVYGDRQDGLEFVSSGWAGRESENIYVIDMYSLISAAPPLGNLLDGEGNLVLDDKKRPIPVYAKLNISGNSVVYWRE